MAKNELPVAAANSEGLRSYEGPWKGELVLVCRKCQKKLKHSGPQKLAKLSKTLRKRAQRQEPALAIRTISVDCLKMCPKGGVTVCTASQAAQHECSILRSVADVDALLDACRANRSSPHA